MSILWQPDPGTAARSALAKFLDRARAQAGCPPATGNTTADWQAAHQWSVRHSDRFWSLLLETEQLLAEGSRRRVVANQHDVEGAQWFPDLRLNYVENLLRGAPDDVALLSVTEDEPDPVPVTRGQLTQRVAAAADAMSSFGVGPGDHVVAIAGHRTSTIIACLAATSLGATWSSCGPELSAPAILDRFRPLAPTTLFYHRQLQAGGQPSDLGDTLQAVVKELPSLRLAVALDGASGSFQTPGRVGGRPVRRSTAPRDERLDDWLAGALPARRSPYTRLPFSHPLFVLFSSGTTGQPKCIVHSAGGTLLAHAKEHRLHCDLGPGSRLFFQTTCGWMMWNWTLSALASGAALVVYDGSPTWPKPSALFDLIGRCGITHFGTSPSYLSLCRARSAALDRSSFGTLRTVLTTGSILTDELFDWAHEQLGPTVQLSSISGGTDIVGCFALGNPLLPVLRGELQSVGLGLDVAAADPDAHGIGELVCRNAFPNRPTGLHGDDDGSAFHAAYFAQRPQVWTHGDRIELCASGGARIHGRCDGVMNIRGIRIGPAEVYRALESMPEIEDACAIEVEDPTPGESALWLLVVLRGGLALDGALRGRIKATLKNRASRHHVPVAIHAVTGLPYTHSGKKSERAAAETLNGRRATNRSALRDPQVLDALAKLAPNA